MVWTTLALIVACLPFVAKVFYWLAVNHLQGTQTGTPECGAGVCEEYVVAQLMLGLDRGYFYWLVPVVLIFFKVIRATLTFSVAPMREEEERTGYAPMWSDVFFWRGYRPLFFLHRVAQILCVEMSLPSECGGLITKPICRSKISTFK